LRTNEEQIIELIQQLQADPKLYFETCLKIQKFGTGELVPFSLNPVQEILHYMMERQLKDLEHVRMIVLKARRFGVSTYVQGRFFRHAAMNHNKVVQITTHSKAATDVMFSMARTMEQNLPPEIKPQMRYSGKRDLHWGSEGGGLNSSYSLSTVGGREVRGSKIDYLHCSEVASWSQGGEDYLLGLLNCVVQGYDTEAVIESTASGVGGVYHDMFWDAHDGNSGWEAVFFPWYIYEPYSKPFDSDEEKEIFRDSLGKDPRYGGEEESGLLGTVCEFDVGEKESLSFEVTLENLHWRRQCIKTQCQNDLRKFHQEFPSNARQAFVTTGRSVFDLDVLTDMVLSSEKRQREAPSEGFYIPVQAYKEGRVKEKYIIEAMEEGDLQVWNRPLKDKEYRIGVDVSEGLEIGRDTDWSVAVVLDATTYEEVALLRTKIDPDLLAWQLTSIGRWYNNAQLFVERNNHGLVTLKFLSDVHLYPNIYSEKILDERSSRTARKIGFHTTVKSKPLIIDYLKELIREREITLHSPKVIDELQTFANMPNGKMAAQPGSHDDCVMALAIACFGCKMFPAAPQWARMTRPYIGKPTIKNFRPSRI
tara:strand:- start:1348 stop:3123 length:1776 start_codon:yes stop_codon:yes gene_type:complete